MGNRWGNSGNSVRLYFLGSKITLQMVIAAMKLKDAYSLVKNWKTKVAIRRLDAEGKKNGRGKNDSGPKDMQGSQDEVLR